LKFPLLERASPLQVSLSVIISHKYLSLSRNFHELAIASSKPWWKAGASYPWDA
jgi:hypothetical protein